MNRRYIMQVDPKEKKPEPPKNPPRQEDSESGLLWVLLVVFAVVAVLALVIKKYWSVLSEAWTESKEGFDAGRMEDPADKPKNPKVSFSEPAIPVKPRGGFTLGDVNDPPPRATAAPKPATPGSPPAYNSPTQAKPSMTDSTHPSPTPAPQGDFEKALAQAGQRMDALLKQTEELNRTVKLAEKAKTDAQVELNKATSELTRQLGIKDEQIGKLESMLDRKSTFPSLRALIDVKKLCLDMLNTKKEVSRDELVSFMTAEIDSQLANLEVQVTEFPAGTPLEKIPGEQVEIDRRHELCDDPAKNNQVARMLRPCYYLERDSKRIVVAKGLVVLYRYQTPSPTPEAPSNPAT